MWLNGACRLVLVGKLTMRSIVPERHQHATRHDLHVRALGTNWLPLTRRTGNAALFFKSASQSAAVFLPERSSSHQATGFFRTRNQCQVKCDGDRLVKRTENQVIFQVFLREISHRFRSAIYQIKIGSTDRHVCVETGQRGREIH
jgi:hypothetical protein